MARTRWRGLRWGLTGLGLTIGLVLAAVAGRALRDLLVGTQPWDPMALGLTVVALGAAALAACVGPARRASGVDPAEALRAQ